MDRRRFLLGASATLGVASVAGGGLLACGDGGGEQADRTRRTARTYGNTTLVRRTAASDAPNVLFITIDDCNDWLGFLNPHPGTRTPNLDALAAECLSFDHTYCAAPMCGPARTAITFGTPPHVNHVYDHLDASLEAYRALAKVTPSLVDDFWAAGYHTVGAGKIYHGQLPGRWDDYRLTPWYIPGHMRKLPDADPATYDPDWISPYDGRRIGRGEHFAYTMIDFGPSGVSPDQEPDGKAALWVRERLRSMPREPFFLGFGNYIPHEPWRVPKKFFDMHPLEEVVVPKIRADDLADLGRYARDDIIDQGHQFETISKSGLWEEAVQAYQAAISFADDRVGLILNELASSPYADNTVVVVWSDHGFHMGEKLHIQKFTLWERGTRVPLLVKVPGRFDHDAARRTTGLDDGHRPDARRALRRRDQDALCRGQPPALVSDPARADARPPITTWQEGNHSVRRGSWRYIRYRTGEQELYDHRRDPDEFDNLASDPAHRAVIAELDAFLPAD